MDEKLKNLLKDLAKQEKKNKKKILATIKEENPKLYAAYKQHRRQKQRWKTLMDEGQQLQKQSNYTKAAEVLEDALEIAREVFGSSGIQYANTLIELGLQYTAVRWHNKAEKVYQEALPIKKEILGVTHPEYAMNLCDFAMLYEITEQHHKIAEIYEQAREAYREQDDEKYAIVSYNLVETYLQIDEYDKVEDICCELIEKLDENSPLLSKANRILSTIDEKRRQHQKHLKQKQQEQEKQQLEREIEEKKQQELEKQREIEEQQKRELEEKQRQQELEKQREIEKKQQELEKQREIEEQKRKKLEQQKSQKQQETPAKEEKKPRKKIVVTTKKRSESEKEHKPPTVIKPTEKRGVNAVKETVAKTDPLKETGERKHKLTVSIFDESRDKIIELSMVKEANFFKVLKFLRKQKKLEHLKEKVICFYLRGQEVPFEITFAELYSVGYQKEERIFMCEKRNRESMDPGLTIRIHQTLVQRGFNKRQQIDEIKKIAKLEGIRESIRDLLDVKFGEEGKEIYPRILEIQDVVTLRYLKSLIKAVNDIAYIESCLQDM